MGQPVVNDCAHPRIQYVTCPDCGQEIDLYDYLETMRLIANLPNTGTNEIGLPGYSPSQAGMIAVASARRVIGGKK